MHRVRREKMAKRREKMANSELSDILRASGFRFNKALGQNFIFDGNLLDAIVSDAGVTAEDTVVEIGTGAGTLTVRWWRSAPAQAPSPRVSPPARKRSFPLKWTRGCALCSTSP